MKQFLLAFAFCIAILSAHQAQAEESSDAAGFIISYHLKGADLDKGTAIARKGEELPPKLWMPLFVGDMVFIRDPESSIVIDMAEAGRVEVKGAQQRFTVEEGGSGDGAWEVVTQIAELFGSEEEEGAPTNLISKGDGSLEIPMAVRGPNFILRDARPLWLAWRGGKEPYDVTLDIDGVRQPLTTVATSEFETALPETGKARFALIVEDSLGKRMRVAFRFRASTPEVPKELATAAARGGAEQAVLAGWLAAQDNGAWRFEAARILRTLAKDDKTAAGLLTAIANGWRPRG